MKFFFPLLLLVLLLTSCAGSQINGRKGQTGVAAGGVTGAIIGQAIGHNTEATLIGTAVGAMLGYMVGNEMDKYDRSQLNHVYERGLSSQSSAWINPDTGNQYSVTPQPAYTPVGSQQTCRDAEIKAIINGREEIIRTQACRDTQGHWVLQ